MSDSEWLATLKVGDRVIVSARKDALHTVQEATKAYLFVGGVKFSRKTGTSVPADKWWPITLEKPTKARLRRMHLESSKALIYYSLKGLDLSDEQVVEIASFVRKVIGRKNEHVE